MANDHASPGSRIVDREPRPVPVGYRAAELAVVPNLCRQRGAGSVGMDHDRVAVPWVKTRDVGTEVVNERCRPERELAVDENPVDPAPLIEEAVLGLNRYAARPETSRGRRVDAHTFAALV